MFARMASLLDITKRVQKIDLTNTGTSRDVEANLQNLRLLHTYFKSLTCRECRTPLSIGRAKDHFSKWLPAAKGTQPAQIPAILCQKCKKYTCIGCRGKPVDGSKAITTLAGTVNNCCDQGKLFGIWALLSTFDDAELSVQKSSTNKVQQSHRHLQAGTGTGYNTGYVIYGRYTLRHHIRKCLPIFGK